MTSGSRSSIDKTSLVQEDDDYGVSNGKQSCCIKGRGPSTVIFVVVLGITLLAGVALTVYFVLETVIKHKPNDNSLNQTCNDPCVLVLVESIPDNLTYPAGSPSHPSTYNGLINLMTAAEHTIEIASFYWSLTGTDIPTDDNSSWQGESVLKTLIQAGRDRGIKIKIAQNKPTDGATYYNNTVLLQKQAGAEVRTLDFEKLLGSGIIHTKMWLIDRKHYYVGSANLDWRSLTQVKEMGSVLYNCSCMAQDMGKLFDVYWDMGAPGASVPKSWPSSYSTQINRNYSMFIKFNNTNATTYLSSSPPPFCPTGRTIDIDAIVDIISSADKFVYLAVMDYFPTTQFIHPKEYWPVIDDAFRRAAFNRNVNVYLLISLWKHTGKEMDVYLKSLNDLYSHYSDIHIWVKLFIVPAFTESQKKIPYGRVNHNKYMVTDKTAYIGTSNWSADYFIDTAGIGFVVNQNRTSSPAKEGDVRQQLEDVFLRDWNSLYAHELSYWDTFWNNTHTYEHTEL